jgi:hypothetical protein
VFNRLAKAVRLVFGISKFLLRRGTEAGENGGREDNARRVCARSPKREEWKSSRRYRAAGKISADVCASAGKRVRLVFPWPAATSIRSARVPAIFQSTFDGARRALDNRRGAFGAFDNFYLLTM